MASTLKFSKQLLPTLERNLGNNKSRSVRYVRRLCKVNGAGIRRQHLSSVTHKIFQKTPLNNAILYQHQMKLVGIRTLRRSDTTDLGMGHSAVSTIFALSSGQGKCGVAVIRVSGPRAGQALLSLGRFHRLPKPRTTVLRMLHHPHTGETLDKGLVIWFPGPRSFTGEDSCELQVHGGPAVVTAVLSALQSLPGLTPAEPGDFTKRAFSHGQLDLTEVEGLADLIHAETEAQRQQALRQMDGALSVLYQQWRKQLIKCAANVAAFIDFSEDELIEDDVLEEVTKSVQALRDELVRHLADGRRGERLRDGVHVAIIGEPNVGKSSILNALCQRPAAIVSPMAGTTRDVIESAINLAGYPVLLSDTAGLREAADLVEQEGVRRARERACNADIKIIVIDAQQLLANGAQKVQMESFLLLHMEELGVIDNTLHQERNDQDWQMSFGDREICHKLDKESTENVSNLGELINFQFGNQSTLVVLNKCDLVDIGLLQRTVHAVDIPWTCLSCLTEQGMDVFLELLTDKVKLLCGNPTSANPSLTQARHRNHITACLKALDSYLQDGNRDLVVGGEHLRQAIYQMGKLTGKITSEEVLDVVFRDFCIGK